MVSRLDFEIGVELETGLIAGHAGLIEAFRQTGTAAVIDRGVRVKRRQRGLTASEMAKSLLAMWTAGGERAEDLDQFRQDKAPAAQTARDFLAQFHGEDAVAGRQGPACRAKPCRCRVWPRPTANSSATCSVAAGEEATLDVDATLIHCEKRAAKRAHDGHLDYQPVVALWAEQDVIPAEESRDGNVPAGSGNRRVVGKHWRRCRAASRISICAATVPSTSTS
jgi:hypothetical protein